VQRCAIELRLLRLEQANSRLEHFEREHLCGSTPSPSPGEDAIQRLRQARVRTRLSTEELLALTRGEGP